MTLNDVTHGVPHVGTRSITARSAVHLHNCAGSRRSHGEGYLYLFSTEGFTQMAQQVDLKRVLASLHNAGAIADGEGRFTKRIRVKGAGRPDVYVVSPDILIAGTEEQTMGFQHAETEKLQRHRGKNSKSQKPCRLQEHPR